MKNGTNVRLEVCKTTRKIAQIFLEVCKTASKIQTTKYFQNRTGVLSYMEELKNIYLSTIFFFFFFFFFFFAFSEIVTPK